MSDLTGQFIANSYQNLVQKPDLTKEEYYNGVGTQINVINRDAIGTVKMFFPVNNNYNNCFDSNGLGINDWEGWAICDGRNGTPDLRGRFPIAKTDTNTTSVKGTSVPTITDVPSSNPLITNNTRFLNVGYRGAGDSSVITNSDLPTLNPILSRKNIPPHRHKYFDGYMQARDGGGPFFSQTLEAYGNSEGVEQSGAIGGGMDIVEGTGASREAAYSIRNTGDGRNNLNGQDDVSLNGSATPAEFYPPYFVLSFAIRIS